MDGKNLPQTSTGQSTPQGAWARTTTDDDYLQEFDNREYYGLPKPKSRDSSGFQSDVSNESEGIIDEITTRLIGNKMKSRNRDTGVHIHIGRFYYTPPTQPLGQGIYGEPMYSNQYVNPPTPCYPNHQFVSSPAGDPTGNFNGQYARNVRKERPSSDTFDKFTLRENRNNMQDTTKKSEVNASTKGQLKHSDYTTLTSCTSGKEAEPIQSLNSGLSKLKLVPSQVDISGVPSQFEVSLEMKGSETVVWTGELKCVPSKTDVREEVQPNRSTPDVFVNTVHVKGDHDVRFCNDDIGPEYVNYNVPFSHNQAFRHANAGSKPDSPPMIQRKGNTAGEQQTKHLRTSDTDATSDFGPRVFSKLLPGSRVWKSIDHLNTDLTSSAKQSSPTRTSCRGLQCIADGLYPDIQDDNEKALIKYILQVHGKSGHWVMLTLENHPMNKFCLEVKAEDSVVSYPVMLTNKSKYKIDPYRKGFKCLCKLVSYYKQNKLPKCKFNLGNPLPKSVIPPTEADADTSDDIKLQYAGVRL